MTERILVERQEAIGHITFNNPEKRNAMSLGMWQGLIDALDRFSKEPGLRVLVLAGAGGRAFVSGADISKFESERSSAADVERYEAVTDKAQERLAGFPLPTIARIDGWCIGGGMAIALACDLRICGTGSQFAIPAARLGVGYGLAGVKRLIDLVGPAVAKEIFFTGRRFGSEEAQRIGLVNHVVNDGEVAEAALSTASTIAANAPLTVRSIKQIAAHVLVDGDGRDPDLCAKLVRECFSSEDYIEGRRAFMEKRAPVFRGR
ncbi:MAG: enoyl-CoA hydratase/isomerase family protein [Geminicoccaceae bacterium]|nr:enoyl-CoA hydratase/isomerase family protein [Geminicoccaceae bacterium]